MSFINTLMAIPGTVASAKKSGSSAISKLRQKTLTQMELNGWQNPEHQVEDNRQVNLQQRLNQQAAQLNYDFGEKAADNAFARQQMMYERQLADNREWDNEGARLKRTIQGYKSVGGNPMLALMNGITGTSGGSAEFATAPTSGGAGGAINAGNAPTSVDHTDAQTRRMQATQDAIRTAKEIALLGAQKRNIEADTDKKGAETTNINKDTEQKGAQIEQIFANIENIKVQTAATDLQMTINQTKLELEKDQTEANIEVLKANKEKISEEASNLFYQARRARIAGDIDEATFNTNIEKAKQELANLQAQEIIMELSAQAAKKGIELTDKQIFKIEKDVDIAYQQLDINEMIADDNFYVDTYNGVIGKDWKLVSPAFENHYRSRKNKNEELIIKTNFKPISWTEYHR